MITLFKEVLAQDCASQYGRDDVSDFMMTRQLDRCDKKFINEKPELKLKAMMSFLELNNSLKEVTPYFHDPLVLEDVRDFIRTALERFTQKHCDVGQVVLDPVLMHSLWRYGPGSSHGLEDVGTHFCQKIGALPTVTSRCSRQFEATMALNPHVRRFYTVTEMRCGSNVSPEWWDFGLNRLNKSINVRGSKLSSVFKNQETARTIAIEPLGNMAEQLAAGMYIEGALRCVGIDISRQADLNKILAMLGSLDGSIATVDLKNASDMFVLALIMLTWPSAWYEHFCNIRSPYIKAFNPLPGVDGSGWVELRMMSTMGNGFTFPMMTLTLAAIAYANHRKMVFDRGGRVPRRCYLDKRYFGVFGDDIIVPADEAESLYDILTCAGLVVNRDKSYSTGFFRESCGGDYFNGQDVTPFYIKGLTTPPEIYSAINALLKWSAKRKIYVYKSLDLLLQLLDNASFDQLGYIYRYEYTTRFLVPQWEDPSSGILCGCGPRQYRKFSFRPSKVEVPVTDSYLRTLCVVGGYAEPGKAPDSLRFTPRSNGEDHGIWKVRSGSIPQGYSDGHDHVYMTMAETVWCDRVLSITLV